MDDLDVKQSKQRRPANRSASAIFQRPGKNQKQKAQQSKQDENSRTWHAVKPNQKEVQKTDMRTVFTTSSNNVNSGTMVKQKAKAPLATSIGNLTEQNHHNERDERETYSVIEKDDGTSTLGRPSTAATSTLQRTFSRGTLKSSSSRTGPLFLVKKRGNIDPVPPAAPGTAADPNDPNNEETAVIANVEQLLAMARVHPTIEYEWIPDDYFI